MVKAVSFLFSPSTRYLCLQVILANNRAIFHPVRPKFLLVPHTSLLQSVVRRCYLLLGIMGCLLVNWNVHQFQPLQGGENVEGDTFINSSQGTFIGRFIGGAGVLET